MNLIPENNVYLTPKEAACKLAVSTGTVRRLIKCGRLEAYRFGNQIRIVSASLEQYIIKQKITG